MKVRELPTEIATFSKTVAALVGGYQKGQGELPYKGEYTAQAIRDDLRRRCLARITPDVILGYIKLKRDKTLDYVDITFCDIRAGEYFGNVSASIQVYLDKLAGNRPVYRVAKTMTVKALDRDTGRYWVFPDVDIKDY